MRETLVFRYCHSHGYAHTIICSECGAFGFNPLSVNPCLNRVFEKIMYGISGLLRYHVHVPLKYDTASVLVSRSGRYPHDDVACLICESIDITLFSPVEDIFAYDFLVLGRAWTTCESVEVVPDYCWLKIFDCHNVMNYCLFPSFVCP